MALKNMHTFLSAASQRLSWAPLPKPQFLHSIITPQWSGSSGPGLLGQQLVHGLGSCLHASQTLSGASDKQNSRVPKVLP